jgi:hypothetical protein
LSRTARLLAALATVPPTASAQTSVHVAFGARAGTALVRDSIVQPIAVRQDPGPLVALTAARTLDSAWSAAATLDVGWNGLRREEPGTAGTEVGTIRTVGVKIALRRRLRPGLAAGLGIGVLGYGHPSSGMFRAGGPGLVPLASAQLRFEPPFAGLTRFAIEAHYDVHRFITPALRDVGFTTPRAAHRVALVLSARLGGGTP